MRPTVDDAVTLQDGRRLAYAEWGDEAAPPLLFFHGTPGSRLLFPGVLARSSAPLRVVTVDRPGYGRSDPLAVRTLLGWADDVAQLADALGLERFTVAGWSGGGPHALACAARLSDRIERAALVSARADHHRIPGGLDELGADERRLVELGAVDRERYREEMAGRAAWLVERRDRPDSFLAVDRPAAEQRVALLPDVASAAMLWLPEAAREGVAGFVEDWLVLRSPWGFDTSDVPVTVDVWHGARDSDVPPRHAEFLAARLPRARLAIWADEGHWGLFPRWAEIAARLSPGS